MVAPKEFKGFSRSLPLGLWQDLCSLLGTYGSKYWFASIQLRPISDYDMLTVGRSARDLLRKKIAP